MTKPASAFSLENKLALVTGGSRGIGRACAIALAKQGARVIVNYQSNEATAGETVRAIVDAGGEAEALRFDVASEAECEAAIRAIGEARGGIDILINNAGVSSGDELLVRQSTEVMRRVLETNLWGAIYCTKACLPFMMRKRWGRIVNMSSVVAASGNVGQTAYAASKAGLEGFTRSLAREYGSRGITSNVVAPGLIKTDMTSYMTEDVLRAAATQIPLRRVGQPEDVAAVVAMLWAHEASYVTGQVIGVNGGMYC
jgi:3-oxoacyl-[acyl-carrier protein] reductase